MKIGTITFWDTEENYGQVLQCYALIKYLQKHGHQATLIRTKPLVGSKRTVIQKVFTLLVMARHPRSLISFFKRTPKTKSNAALPIVDRGFAQFKIKYIPSTSSIFSYEDLVNSPLDYDAIICGSDQIWSAISPLMFLQFPGKFKRIAYAASFGGFQIKNILDRKQVKFWLDSFDFISVREKEGVEMCLSLGAKAFLFPDPTLLLNKSDYEGIIGDSVIKNDKPYILLYLLGNKIDVDVKLFFDFAHLKGIDIKYVASQGRTDDFEKVFPSIPEWLSLIRNARAVITNSFHGTVFSLIFNTPFITVPLSGNVTRMNGRITDLLSKYHLEDRLFMGNLECLLEDANFSLFNKVKEEDCKFVTNLMSNLLVEK